MNKTFAQFMVWLVLGLTAIAGPQIQVGDAYHTDGRTTPKLLFLDSTATPTKASTSPEDTARQYISDNHDRFALPQDLSNLQLTLTKESLLGTHLYFGQFIGNVPVDKAEIVVSVSRSDGHIFRVFNNTYPGSEGVKLPKTLISSNAALDAAWAQLKVHGALRSLPKAELIYEPTNGGFRLAYRTSIHSEAPAGQWEHLVDAQTGEIISYRDRIVYDHFGAGKGASEAERKSDIADYTGPVLSRSDAEAQFQASQAATPTSKASPSAMKTTVDGTGLVFDPDPKTTLLSETLTDSSAASAFAGAYFTRTLKSISLNSGVYALTGPWVTITNIEPPDTAPSTTTTGSWTNQRGTNAFNDSTVYFQLDQSQRYIQTLGFSGATGIQYGSIPADTDGEYGDDNARYDPSANNLAFGHGGIDDAEDTSVVLHEYGHSLEQSMDPNWGGGDCGAMGEGFADYWGASYVYGTPNGAIFHPDWVAKWDGHNIYWDGRILNGTGLYDSNNTYEAHTVTGGVDGDELWSAPIYQSLTNLMSRGRSHTEMDTIMLEAHFGLGSGLKMPDFAKVIVQTAQALFPTGIHAQVIFEQFTNHLILTSYPLPTPTILRPISGEHAVTGQVLGVTWLAPMAPTSAITVIQYTDNPGGGGSFFQDSVESGTNGWTPGSTGGGVNWQIVTNSAKSPTHSWFGTNKITIGSLYLTHTFTLSNSASLSFSHRYDLEPGYDGGVIEISTNGGGSWIDLGNNITSNPYNTTIATAYNSPIAGRRAFSGYSAAFAPTVIDLSDYGGKTVSIRFRVATDSANSSTYIGWWIDDISLRIGTAWTPVASVSVDQVTYPWTTPAVPGTNYVVRLKLTDNDSSTPWATGSPFTLSADSDADGIPDSWELLHFPSLTNLTATSDTDGDGFSDVDEERAGTSITDAHSLLVLGAVTSSAPSSAIAWQSATNRVYRLMRSSNLSLGFSTLSSNILATPPTNTYSDSAVTNSHSAFYQIRVQP